MTKMKNQNKQKKICLNLNKKVKFEDYKYCLGANRLEINKSR